MASPSVEVMPLWLAGEGIISTMGGRDRRYLNTGCGKAVEC